jgi:hypothetical protein
MKITSILFLGLIYVQLFAYSKNRAIEPALNNNNTDSMKLKITIGSNIFFATLQKNASAKAFKKKLPMTINMTELNGNEKYFDLLGNLPINASNPGTIQTGDLMLYGSNTIVLFYKTFLTPYNYTRLGHIDNPSGLAAALGAGNSTVTFELQ